jgi:hypothetical protein
VVVCPSFPVTQFLSAMTNLLHCKTCGKDQTIPGVKLRKCSKCKGSAYCSKRQSSGMCFLCRRVVSKASIANEKIGLHTRGSAVTGTISIVNVGMVQNTKASWN